MRSYTLKLTCAIAVDGQVLRPGTLVEMSEAEAKNLLGRGKAVLATEVDGVKAQPESSKAAKSTRNAAVEAE